MNAFRAIYKPHFLLELTLSIYTIYLKTIAAENQSVRAMV
jgi:hypothetical protein